MHMSLIMRNETLFTQKNCLQREEGEKGGGGGGVYKEELGVFELKIFVK